MFEKPLSGCRVLVVEDEYMIADELQIELGSVGATVLGPVGTVEEALALIAREHHIDGAVLDVNLRGEMGFPVADLLVERGVPFVLTTGYDASSIPARFGEIARCEKPVNMKRVTQAIGQVIHRREDG